MNSAISWLFLNICVGYPKTKVLTKKSGEGSEGGVISKGGHFICTQPGCYVFIHMIYSILMLYFMFLFTWYIPFLCYILCYFIFIWIIDKTYISTEECKSRLCFIWLRYDGLFCYPKLHERIHTPCVHACMCMLMNINNQPWRLILAYTENFVNFWLKLAAIPGGADLPPPSTPG